MKRLGLVMLCVFVCGLPRASALDRAGHLQPAGPGARHFPSNFQVPNDTEWKAWKLGGFGGPTNERSVHLPVIFVHGNNTDSAGWYPVADQMTKSLHWGHGDLWGVTYNGVGCSNDTALFTTNNGYHGWTASSDRAASTGCVVTGNEQNVADVKAFVDAVMRYTRVTRVNIVAHSLGVTVVRRMLWENPTYYAKVAAVVAIAGGNHGTSFCPPGSESDVESCDEIAKNTLWLHQINDGPRGRKPGAIDSNDAPGPTKWMTVLDGSGQGDPAFAGPVYALSPMLQGATNCFYQDFYHNDLRVDPRIVKAYTDFLTAVERHRSFRCPFAPPFGPPN